MCKLEGFSQLHFIRVADPMIMLRNCKFRRATNQGNARLNLKLSKDRVAVVEKYFISKGIDKKRVSGIGYGSTKPIADNKKEQTRKLNRRVEFSVIKF